MRATVFVCEYDHQTAAEKFLKLLFCCILPQFQLKKESLSACSNHHADLWVMRSVVGQIFKPGFLRTMYIFAELYFIFSIIKGLCLATLPLNPNIRRIQEIVAICSTQPVLPRYSCPSSFVYVTFSVFVPFSRLIALNNEILLMLQKLSANYGLCNEMQLRKR